MTDFDPNLVLDGYAFLTEFELEKWSPFGRGFRAKDAEDNYYILELINKKRRGMDFLIGFQHKTLLTCIDIKQSDDGRWIQILEYFPGDTLRDMINSGEKFSPLDIVIICLQICNGLSAIHSLNLIHEDLRPENVLINSQGEIKLKGILIPEVLVNYSSIPECWNYIAPEQISKSVWISPGPTANAFSLGAIMYELLTGKKYGRSINEIDMAIKDSKDPILSLRSQIESFPMSELPDDILQEFSFIIKNSLVIEPEGRLDINGIAEILSSIINKSLPDNSQEQQADVSAEEVQVLEEEQVLEQKVSQIDEEVQESSLETKTPLPEDQASNTRLRILRAREEMLNTDIYVPPDRATVELNAQDIEEALVKTDDYNERNEGSVSEASVYEEKVDSVEQDYEEYTPEVKEFIPSVSGGFFSQDFYEKMKEDYEANISGSDLREHSFYMSSDLKTEFIYKEKYDEPEEIDREKNILRFTDKPTVSGETIDVITNKLDHLIKEFSSLRENTFKNMEGIYKYVQEKALPDEKNQVISNHILIIKKLLFHFFFKLNDLIDSMDREYSTGNFIKDFMEGLILDEKTPSDENSITELLTIKSYLERATDIIGASSELMKMKENKIGGLESFIKSFTKNLKVEYKNLVMDFYKYRDIEKSFGNREDLLKFLENLSPYLLNLKSYLNSGIKAYLERLVFLYRIYYFYMELISKKSEDIPNLLSKNIEFFNEKIFSEPIFDNVLENEDNYNQEEFLTFISLPVDVQLYIKDILKNKYGLSPLDITLGEDYFNPERHNITGTIYTDMTEQVYRVSEVISPGYIYNSEIFKRADIKIYINRSV